MIFRHPVFLRLFLGNQNSQRYWAILLFLIVGAGCSETQTNLLAPATMPLQCSLTGLVEQAGLADAINEKRFAIGIADITDPRHPEVAALNPHIMLYAASVPKIAILFAMFKQIDEGTLEWSEELRVKAEQMIRSSSNTAATELYNLVGADYILKLLTAKNYKLYDLSRGGGLWIGKEYGPEPAVYRDPIKGLSHGATVYSLLRFYYLLEMQQLVSPDSTLKMREIMSQSDYQSKLLYGLARCCPSARYLRKAGAWRDHHADSVLVWHDGRRYIVAAIIEDPIGEEILGMLGEKIDLIMHNRQAFCRR